MNSQTSKNIAESACSAVQYMQDNRDAIKVVFCRVAMTIPGSDELDECVMTIERRTKP